MSAPDPGIHSSKESQINVTRLNRIARPLVRVGLVAAVAVAAAQSQTQRLIPLFPSATDDSRQGFLRVLNRSPWAGTVWLEAVDGGARSRASLTLAVEAEGSVRIGSADLRVHDGDGGGALDWRVQLTSDVDVEALAYVRAADGALTVIRGYAQGLATPGDPGLLSEFAETGPVPGSGLRAIRAADLDGDGDADAVSVSFDEDTVAWQENLGAGELSAPRVLLRDADGASSVHAADLDGDGDLDVLWASHLDDTIGWQENLGGGAFSARRAIAVDALGASSVYSADLDGDGDADVLSASMIDDTVAWYENLGAGTFSARRTLSADALGAASVHATDLDGDHDTDVLAVSRFDHTVAWFENLGRGEFSARRPIATDALGAASVHAADLDGDGDADVLWASNEDGTVAWQENFGGGAFSGPRAITTGVPGVSQVYAADVDGDGDLDVLFASHDNDSLAWHENLGEGRFSPPRPIAGGALGAASVHAADMDGDGDADVLSAFRFDRTAVWHENLGGGTFAGALPVSGDGFGAALPAALLSDPRIVAAGGAGGAVVGSSSLAFDAVATHPELLGQAFSDRRIIADGADGAHSVYSADLDGDGDADVLSGSFEDNTVAWYENDGTGGFAAGSHVIATDADGVVSVRAADLDGDGDADVLSGSFGNDTVAWYENDGTGGFAAGSHVIATDADGVSSVHAVDLDGDGDIDVLTASGLDDTVAWHENLSDGAFSDRRIVEDDADGAMSVYSADLDGDGDADVISASLIDNTVAWHENLGDGAFSERRAIWTDAEGAISVHAADLDGDGDADVLSASYYDDTVAWHENQGDGTFSERRVIMDAADGAISVRAADLDGDGDADVVSASYYDDTVAWHENLGDGAFSSRRVIADDADGAHSVHVEDLDGDGVGDVLSASFGDDRIAWHRNLATPTGRDFSAQRVITTSPPMRYPQSVHAADLDGDGDADVLSASLSDVGIAWHENLGGGRFSAQRAIGEVANGDSSVHAADLDGDGDADVLSASFSDDRIAWHENLGGNTFSDERTITTNVDSAYSVHAADLDGDGDADVLSASGDGNDDDINDNKIAWYENLGEGTFSAQYIITIDALGARSVHAADLDGDGDADVLSASSDDDKIAWYENLGGGMFSEQLTITTDADGAWFVHAADLDGDGDADVLSASEFDDRIAWYENLGGGTFSAGRTITTDADGAISAYAADLDGDGDMDVLSASFAGDSIAWYENLGGGMFSAGRTIATGATGATGADGADGAFSVYAADLDGDGDADALSASLNDHKIAWYENLFDHGDDHADTLEAATLALTLPTFLHGVLESAGDRDVFRVATGGGTLRVRSNGPTNTFGRLLDAEGVELASNDDDGSEFNFEIEASVAAGVYYVAVSGYEATATGPYTLSIEFIAGETAPTAAPGDIAVAAVQDGLTVSWEPLAAAATGGNPVLRYLVTATPDDGGAVASCTAEPPATGCTLSGLRPGVAYGVVVQAENALGAGPQSVSVAGTPARRIFSPERTITTNAASARSVYAADLDGDGDADVLSASYGDDRIAWYENEGGGMFSEQRTITPDPDDPDGADRADGAQSVYAADLDGDGDADVLSASSLDDRIAWYENEGGGAFSNQRTITTNADGARSVHAADLDGDGDPDVLSASYGDDKIAWYENEGEGVFSAQRTITTVARGAFSVYAADLDGDGDPDVLSASADDHGIAWYENLGGGMFSQQRTITTRGKRARGARGVYAADLDGDGDVDVLSASRVDDKIAWYENLGGGTFSEQLTITTGADGARSVHAADLDGDRIADVLSASFDDDRIAWYEGGGAFSEQRTITPSMTDPDGADGAISVYAADLDGDGDADVLSASEFDDKIAWYENLSDHGDDHGDTPDGATLALTLPAFQHGVLESAGDRDVFRVATGSGTLRVSSNGPTDTVGTLLDAAGGELASNDDDGSELNFEIEATVAAGVHYVAVSGYDAEATGPYTLSIEFIAGETAAPTEAPGEIAVMAINGGLTVSWEPLAATATGGSPVLRYLVTATPDDGGAVASCTAEPPATGCTLSGLADGVSYGVVVRAENAHGAGPSSVSVAATPARVDSFSAQRTITIDLGGARSVYLADLDGDGDPDVFSASGDDDRIAWYENLGGGTFSAQRTITTDTDGARSAHAVDLDGDGDADVLSASFDDNKIAWYENVGGGEFSEQRTITTDADGAVSIYAADLDGDGDADVLSASLNDAKIAWYENEGGGAFSAQRIITTAAHFALFVYAVDLDGDGDADVLSASGILSGIGWYENEGGGEFSARRTIITDADRIHSVYVADVDGDGDADVLSASRDAGGDFEIAWYENLGGGTFSAQRTITTDALGARSVHAADLDGDGDADVLFESADRIAWYENLGGGTFSAQRTITTDALGARSVHAADLDGDGDADVLFESADRIAWYENLSDHGDDHGDTLEGATLALTLPAFQHGVLESAGDRDVFRVATGSGTLRVSSNGPTDTSGTLLDAEGEQLASNSGGGLGQNFKIEEPVEAGVHYVAVSGSGGVVTGPYTLSIEFIAGETVAPTEAPGEIAVMAINGGLTVSWEPLAAVATGGIPVLRYLVTATPDDGGAVASCTAEPPATGCTLSGLRPGVSYGVVVRAENALGAGPSSVSVAGMPARGDFSAQRTITTDADYALSVYAVDLDGDGDADVLSASGSDNRIAWYENEGGGVFSAQRTITTSARVARSVYAADLDGDGDADVLSASGSDNRIAWYENEGGGVFSAQRTITTNAIGAYSVYAADLDGDGDADVLSASIGEDKIAWYENLGGGMFSAQRTITTDADDAVSVYAADLDGDGDADVLSASYIDNRIAWYENEGGGVFSAQRTITTDADHASSVYAADLDGDGDADVLSASWIDNRIAWYENEAGGTFSEQRTITTDADNAWSVYAADLDGDGDADVLSASRNDDKIAWYENEGGGVFSAQRTITTGADGANSVYAADLDGDGDADVLSASYIDNRIAWYENLSDHGDDHGDTPEGATLALTLPAFQHGVLESAGDRDVFRVATGSGTLRVSSNGPTDTFGTLLDAESGELASNDDDGSGQNFEIEAPVEAGVHYVAVSGAGAVATGPYTLSIEFVADAATVYRPSDGGFELDLDHPNTHGIVHANDRFYVVNGPRDTVFAYRSTGERDEEADFALGIRYPNGIAYANDRFYVVADQPERVYAYLSNGERDAVADFGLDPANGTPGGIVHANGRFYIVDTLADKVFAYGENGERDASADFDLGIEYARAEGIAYGDDRFYVVSAIHDRVYVYGALGERDAAGDFRLEPENGSAEGITHVNGGLFVVDAYDDRVYAYRSDGAQTPGSPVFVLDNAAPRPMGLTFAEDRFYVFSHQDDVFAAPQIVAYGASWERDLEFAPAILGDTGTGNLHGLAYANDRFYIADSGEPERLLAYGADGERDESRDIDLDDENGNPQSATYVNGRFYVLDFFGGVFVYGAEGERHAEADFPVRGGATGIAHANDRFYIADVLGDEFLAYRADGERDADADFDLDDGNTRPAGIVHADGKFYVIDGFDKKVYVY